MNDVNELTLKERIEKFFRKKNIDADSIKYILPENNKTVIYLSDGRMVSTYTSAGDIMTVLPMGNFFHVNRGMYLAIREVAHIDDNVYTMLDGRTVTGRAYQMEQHEANRQILLGLSSIKISSISIYDRFSGMDNYPLAVCVMEVLTNDSKNVEFIIRYCNDAMARLDNIPKENIIGNSVYDIYDEGDRLRLAAYADVASSGHTHILERIDPKDGKRHQIYCFQPAKGFCACIQR